MNFRAFAVALAAAAVTVAGFVSGPQQPAMAISETVELDLSLADTLHLDATLSDVDASVQDDALVASGILAGTATLLGESVDIAAQSFTLTASTSCKGGSGTLILSTSQIEGTLDGKAVTVEPATVTVKATCGKTPTLTLTTDPLAAMVGESTVSTSKCSVTVSSPAATPLGGSICQVKESICELNGLLRDGTAAPEDIVAQLDSTLTALADALTL